MQRIGCSKERASGKRGGQSTLEYILVLSAILVALIAIVGTTIAGQNGAMNTTLTESSNTITAATGKIKSKLGL